MNKIKGFILSLLITLLIGAFLAMGYMTEESFAMPESIYQVYLDGEIKKEFNVDQVYPPKGFKIIRQTTYEEELNSVEEVYESIKEKKEFTIKGYSINIKGSLEGVEPQYVYVIDETIFEEALANVVVTFIGEERYKQYLTALTKGRLEKRPMDIITRYRMMTDNYVKHLEAGVIKAQTKCKAAFEKHL